MASASGPVTGAMVAARASRLGAAVTPAPARTAAAGCGSEPTMTPSAGQQDGLVHRYDQHRPSSTRRRSCSRIPAPGRTCAGLVGERGDERAGPVTDHDGVGELVPGEQDGRVADDLRRHGGVGRVGQVEPEREPHPAVRARHGEDDQAAVRDGSRAGKGRRRSGRPRRGPGPWRMARAESRTASSRKAPSEKATGTGGPRGPARPWGWSGRGDAGQDLRLGLLVRGQVGRLAVSGGSAGGLAGRRSRCGGCRRPSTRRSRGRAG